MFRSIFRGLCANLAGRMLVAGTIGVLTGVECLMSTRPRASRPKPVRSPAPRIDVNVSAPMVASRADYLKIYRTKSELGYTYWVLQGFGCYKCFVLFDSWREATADAANRVREMAVPDNQLAMAVSRM